MKMVGKYEHLITTIIENDTNELSRYFYILDDFAKRNRNNPLFMKCV